MVKFEASTEEDVNRIREWTDSDIYHRERNLPEWWLTGSGLLSFALYDDKGPVFYVRIDTGADGEYARLNVQFAPEEVVPKIRLAKAMIQTLPKLIEIAKKHGIEGFIFDSISPRLVIFMERLGFVKVAEDDCYLLLFGE